MLTLPPVILDLLHLDAGSTVSLAVEGGRLVIAAQPRSRYRLADLMDSTDVNVTRTEEEQEWLHAAAIGAEPI